MKKIILPLFVLLFYINVSTGQSTATYDIVFESIWESVTDNPTDGQSTIDLPGNPHWSPLVGATHATANSFLEMGQAATTGVEFVAETGSWTSFQTEVNSNSDANQFINGGGLNTARGTITIDDLQVNENYPLLTLISMIAPSPDWFVAINSYDLRNGGSWVSSVTIDLFPYDAGTENGTGYALDNPATNPQGVITDRTNITPFNEKKIGTITITLESVLNTDDNSLPEFRLSPNPANDKITVTNSQNVPLKTIEIYSVIESLSKRIPIENNSSELQIDVSNLNSGIYFVKLNTKENLSMTKKFIVK